MWSSLSLVAAALMSITVTVEAGPMTNSWAVQVHSDGKEAADALANKYGFINLGEVGNLKNMYHFVMPVTVKGERSRSINEYQSAQHITNQLRAENNVGYVKQQERRKLYKKAGYDIPNDPNWNDQWSLLNTGLLNTSDVGNDIKAQRAWLQGVTGCGIFAAIVDDGVDYTHSDLSKNYVSSLQNDFLERDGDPFPGTVDGVQDEHGTNCAGEIGMEKGNGVCGVGVAYNSFITGLRLIGAPGATDIDETEALSWQNDVIDIYSNSWGPEDDGSTVDGPGDILQMALQTNTREGRQGKGSIYVFAAGNGGRGDTCAADGYTNSIYTISVGSASSDGRQSVFDEECSGKMVVTFDSDSYNGTRHVTTTTVKNDCTGEFVGTSASTPLVSGVLTLLLEVNSNLTWRDVQYLLVYTSNTNRLVNGEWITNGAGRLVSHKFGFGAIDAEAIISRGRHWINVPPQLSQSVVPPNNNHVIASRSNATLSFTVQSNITFLEHVVVIFNMNFVGVTEDAYYMYRDDYYDNGAPVTWPERGTIQVELTSPSGTTSIILPQRLLDIFPGEYNSWPLMSLHFWGEDPSGEWTILIKFMDVLGSIQTEVSNVEFFGTSQIPEAVSRIPAACSEECDPTRGCAATGAKFCDACAVLRIASTLECTSSCPVNLTERDGYCYNETETETNCLAASAPNNSESTPNNSESTPNNSESTPNNSAVSMFGRNAYIMTVVTMATLLMKI